MNPQADTDPPMLTLKTVDRAIGLLVIGLILMGSYSWWRSMQRSLAMNGMMGMMPGMNPIWYLFGTLIAVSVILGVYILSREQLDAILLTPASTATDNRNHPDTSTDSNSPGRSSERASEETTQESPTNVVTPDRPSVLTFLPEDEQRIIAPILESPGLTQVELRGRSGFSKAKVSQTVSVLEDRGLIYREKQGRTYRVYPGELVKDHQHS